MNKLEITFREPGSFFYEIIIRDPETGKSRVFGYSRYPGAEDIGEAILDFQFMYGSKRERRERQEQRERYCPCPLINRCPNGCGVCTMRSHL